MGNVEKVLKKLKGLDSGKQLALVDAFPGQRDGVDAVLRGEKRIILEDVIRKFFDRTSRCIPVHFDVKSNVCDENRDFHVELPELSCTEIIERATSFFPKGTEFAETSRFDDETATLKEKYADHELIGNFFKRARRIVLPKHDARKNYGASLHDFILPTVQAAYKKSFPKRKFVNRCDGRLAENVKIIPGTGHDKLVSLMAEKSVSAWYLPNPFQGFSIFAQCEVMEVLKQYGFALAGGIDTGTATVAYTNAMARDFHTPVYVCSALFWQSAVYSLHFRADDDEFYFDFTSLFAEAYGFLSAGLVPGGGESSSGAVPVAKKALEWYFRDEK